MQIKLKGGAIVKSVVAIRAGANKDHMIFRSEGYPYMRSVLMSEVAEPENLAWDDIELEQLGPTAEQTLARLNG